MTRVLFIGTIIFFLSFNPNLRGQISTFPYKENFDTVSVPKLPAGWVTSKNKLAAGDFWTIASTFHSAPNCLIDSNSTKAQWIISPQFNFTGKIVDSITFWERRTGTHNSGVLLEAAINEDTTFLIRISQDTLKNPGNTSYLRRAYSLPDTLNNQSNVRFRLHIIGNGTGTSSSSIRFDDIQVSVKKMIELAATSLTFSPPNPSKGENVTVTVAIINKALAGNFSFNVQLYDSLTLVATTHISRSLYTSETMQIELQYPNIAGGRHPLSAKIILNGDEDTTNNAIASVLYARFPPRTILINEIMYAPASPMPEWVECVNNSDDTILVSEWKMSSKGTTHYALSPSQKTIFPHSYFIVTRDTTLLKNFYTITGLLLQALFPTSLFTNDSDAVMLYEPTNAVIDSLFYHFSWGGSSTERKSLERIDTAVSSTLQSNWATSRNPLGATPGFINSVSKKEYDVSVERISFSPPFPVSGQQVTISAVIKNIGKQSLHNAAVKFFLDANKDSVLDASEMISQQSIGLLAANDSADVTAITPPLQQGTHWIFAQASAEQDDDNTNNLLRVVITVGIQPRSIVINEIMYAPKGDEPEWFECYNTTSSEISISGWKVSDAGSTKAAIQNVNATIEPHSFFIVAHDTTFKNYHTVSVPVFQSSFSRLYNSTPDAVVLYDDRGAVMDSVYYKQSWGGSNGNNSLQRFDFFSPSNDSTNWIAAAPSPGIANPVAKKEFDAAIRRFSAVTIENGVHFSCTLFNAGRQTVASAILKLYHDESSDSIPQTNELLHSEEIPLLNPSDSVVISWNWSAQFSGKQQFIAVVEYARDERLENNATVTSVQNNFAPQTLVINEIMYDPASDKAEFVELYNSSADSIDIFNWKLMNQATSSGKRARVVLSNKRFFLAPKEFILVATDSSIFSQFPDLFVKKVVVNSSMTLNNSGEDVVLVDLTDAQIDSIHYSPSWHLKNISTKGRSLERINPNGIGNDARNWSTSVSPSGATPGATNSIYTPSLPSTSSLKLSPNPFSPDNDGFEDFLSINYSLPTNSSTIRIRIYDVTGRLVRLLANDEPAPASGTVIWNGLDDKGERVRIGMYIILFEALDNFGGTVRTMKDVAVVAGKL